jgi:type VI protein secretion system component VasF
VTVVLFRDQPEAASLHLRIRAIRRRRLASRLTSLTLAGAWLAVVTMMFMVGGGLLNTR